jgi:hypothetical protein
MSFEPYNILRIVKADNRISFNKLMYYEVGSHNNIDLEISANLNVGILDFAKPGVYCPISLSIKITFNVVL